MKDYRIKPSMHIYIVAMSMFSIYIFRVYTKIPSKHNSQCRKYYQSSQGVLKGISMYLLNSAIKLSWK